MFSVNGDSWYSDQTDPAGAPPGTIQQWTAPAPWGPWTGPSNVYVPPEGALYGDSTVYNVAVHPDISGINSLLISYNSTWPGCLGGYGHPDSYRPKFIRVVDP